MSEENGYTDDDLVISDGFDDESEAARQKCQSKPASSNNKGEDKAVAEVEKIEAEIIAESQKMLEDKSDAELETVIYHRNWWELLKSSLVYIYLGLSWIFVGSGIYGFVSAVATMDIKRFMPDDRLALWFIFGVFVWMFSTMIKHWTYQSRIKTFFITELALLFVMLLSLFFYLPYKLIIPIIFLEPNAWVTENDWIFLYRNITVPPAAALAGLCTFNVAKIVFNKITLSKIYAFRLANYIDIRKNKRFAYDVRHVIYKISNALAFLLPETDRFLHMLIVGATGTAKTSSIITPMANDDMLQRCKNEDKLAEGIIKMMENKEAYMTGPVTNGDFLRSVCPVEGKEKKLNALKDRYRMCGLTIMGPDASLSDDIFELAKAKGIKVNRLDPIPKDSRSGAYKEGYMGFNPLFISPDIPSWALKREIVKKATLFADVLQSIDDMRGHGDPYFTNLNRCITVVFCICLMKVYPLLNNGKQPTPRELMNCINDFEEIRGCYNKLTLIDTKGDYKFVTTFIELDIFGPGHDKMVDQARGLRNLIDILLANPQIEAALCVDDEHALDMDKMLSEGQITVVNYALELGQTDSTGFGLFFLLSFLDAVLRRPGSEKTRIPHFFYLDETAVLLTPRLEQALSLFRKFRCSCVFCLQSLDQLGKNEMTRYLKGVIMSGCAQHFVFGRCGTEEMKQYSELCGRDWVVTEMESVSETAVTTDNPSIAFQSRSQLTKDNVMEGSELRNLNFQEITVFAVKNGNLVKPFFAKVNFLERIKRNPIKRLKVDWDDMYRRYSYTNLVPEGKTLKAIENAITPSESVVKTMKAAELHLEGQTAMETKSENEEQEQEASANTNPLDANYKNATAEPTDNEEELPEAEGNSHETKNNSKKDVTFTTDDSENMFF